MRKPEETPPVTSCNDNYATPQNFCFYSTIHPDQMTRHTVALTAKIILMMHLSPPCRTRRIRLIFHGTANRPGLQLKGGFKCVINACSGPTDTFNISPRRRGELRQSDPKRQIKTPSRNSWRDGAQRRKQD